MQVEGLRTAEDHYHLATAPVRDAASNVSGAVLTMRNFTKFHTLVTVVRKIISAGAVEKALPAVLEAMGILGNKSARIYLVKILNGEKRLVSRLATGLDDEKRSNFNAEGVTLAPYDPNHHSWCCIVNGKEQIFTWRPKGNEGEVIHTKSGLEAQVVTMPEHQFNLARIPGEYWMELPLFASNGQPLGKLATEIPEDLDPQQFWILQVLAAFAAVTIETFRTLEQQEEERRQWEENVYQKSLSLVAHHLLNRVIALDGLHLRYQKAEQRPVDLSGLNRDFGELLKTIIATVERARDFLLPPQPKMERVDLNVLCAHVVSSQLATPAIETKYECAAGQVIVNADPQLVSLALAEVLDNARKAVFPVSEPCILVELDSDDGAAAIRVHDNGPGIAVEDYEEIFRDFSSAWSNGVKRSTGLGLGWIRRVFQAHQGEVKIGRSPRLGGACFVLTLQSDLQGRSDG
jgi:signal transduction histidine kinase